MSDQNEYGECEVHGLFFPGGMPCVRCHLDTTKAKGAAASKKPREFWITIDDEGLSREVFYAYKKPKPFTEDNVHVIEANAKTLTAELMFETLGMVDHVGMPEPYAGIVRETLAKAGKR